MVFRRLTIVFVLLLSILFSACEKKQGAVAGTNQPASAPNAPAGQTLQLLVGSENKELSPIFDAFKRENNVTIRMTYKGSVDGMMELKQGANAPYDAAWLSSRLWINLGDTQKVVKNAQSVMNSPVVFAVKKSKAKELGWVDNPKVTVTDILNAVTSLKIRFAMTSATQSNTGASALLGFYSAMAKSPEVLTTTHLKDPSVQEQTAKLVGSVNRLFGSSGYLASDLVEHPEKYDSMVNYEALVISANRQLVAKGEEPLYVIYPSDGLSIADFPLGCISHNDAEKDALCAKLQTYIQSESVQRQILALGRRTQAIGTNTAAADKQVFNPDWGIDVSRALTPIAIPNADVITYGLELYQTSLRKPSLTVFILDFSGSMRMNGGETQVKDAMEMLLEPEIAKRYMLQVSPKDITAIFLYSSDTQPPIEIVGNSPEKLRAANARIRATNADGGTNTHAALSRAFDYLNEHKQERQDHVVSVILMTDGEANDEVDVFKQKIQALGMRGDVPLYAIRFGDASEAQLKELITYASGKYFDGSKGLVPVFREVKGYN